MACPYLEYRDPGEEFAVDVPRAYCAAAERFVQPLRADVCNDRYDLDHAVHCEIYRAHAGDDDAGARTDGGNGAEAARTDGGGGAQATQTNGGGGDQATRRNGGGGDQATRRNGGGGVDAGRAAGDAPSTDGEGRP